MQYTIKYQQTDKTHTIHIEHQQTDETHAIHNQIPTKP